MQLDKYLMTKQLIEEIENSLLEIADKIESLGYKSNVLTDGPRASIKADGVDKLIKLLDKQNLLNKKLKLLKIDLDEEKQELMNYFNQFKSLDKRTAYKLKYIDNASITEIAEKINKSYWATIKILKR